MTGFVKLDVGILTSTLWPQKDARDVFLVALLMATPVELLEPTPELKIRFGEPTGWSVPPGWYGFVAAAGVALYHRALIDDKERGYCALEILASPEADSRTPDFEGRRLVRVSGGFLVLNFIKYRDRDYTSAERSRRWRDRQKKKRDATRVTHDATRDNTQAEAEAEAYRSGSPSVQPPAAAAQSSYVLGPPVPGDPASGSKPLGQLARAVEARHAARRKREAEEQRRREDEVRRLRETRA